MHYQYLLSLAMVVITANGLNIRQQAAPVTVTTTVAATTVTVSANHSATSGASVSNPSSVIPAGSPANATSSAVSGNVTAGSASASAASASASTTGKDIKVWLTVGTDATVADMDNSNYIAGPKQVPLQINTAKFPRWRVTAKYDNKINNFLCNLSLTDPIAVVSAGEYGFLLQGPADALSPGSQSGKTNLYMVCNAWTGQ